MTWLNNAVYKITMDEEVTTVPMHPVGRPCDSIEHFYEQAAQWKTAEYINDGNTQQPQATEQDTLYSMLGPEVDNGEVRAEASADMHYEMVNNSILC